MLKENAFCNYVFQTQSLWKAQPFQENTMEKKAGICHRQSIKRKKWRILKFNVKVCDVK